jgi:hypothetical protein
VAISASIACSAMSTGVLVACSVARSSMCLQNPVIQIPV